MCSETSLPNRSTCYSTDKGMYGREAVNSWWKAFWGSKGFVECHEEYPCQNVIKMYLQGSHSHGKSWKVMEKKAVMESHGKVMETEENK